MTKMELWNWDSLSDIFLVKSLRNTLNTFQSSNMAMTHILFVDDFLIKASISREIPIAMFDYLSVTKTMKGK